MYNLYILLGVCCIIILIAVILISCRRESYKKIENFNSQYLTEIHTIIVWNTNKSKQTRARKIISKHPNIIITLEKNIDLHGKAFNISSGGINTQKPFTLFILKNINPIYIEKRTHAAKQLVNKVMFSIKSKIRGNYSNFKEAHGSFNVEEAREILHELNMKKYIDDELPKFNTLGEMFERLNRYNVTWVVERSFTDDDFKKALDGACDIDVMTTDYYKFKAAVGGQNNRPKRKEQDNGYIIQNKVKIGDKIIALDIRFVGDKYYPTKWMKHILKTRVKMTNKYGTFYIPTEKNQIWMLYYHTFIRLRPEHKRKKTKHQLLKLLKNNNMSQDLQNLKIKFCQFIHKNKYIIENPEDIGVQIKKNYCND